MGGDASRFTLMAITSGGVRHFSLHLIVHAIRNNGVRHDRCPPRWKEHACIRCGTVYAYQLFAQGRGTAAAGPRREAQVKASSLRLRPDPCVENSHATSARRCGSYQPDMVARQRRQHMLSTGIRDHAAWIRDRCALMRGFDGLRDDGLPVPDNQITWLAAAACGMAAAAFWRIESHNPNHDIQSNLRLASAAASPPGESSILPLNLPTALHGDAASHRTLIPLVVLGLLLAAYVVAKAPGHCPRLVSAGR